MKIVSYLICENNYNTILSNLTVKDLYMYDIILTWYKNNKIHRDKKPARIMFTLYNKKSNIKKNKYNLYQINKSWFKNGEYCRDDDLPPFESYYRTGKIRYKQYGYQSPNGGDLIYHRENDLPATIEYYENGNISSEIWYRHNYATRDNDLPVFKEYDQNGILTRLNWEGNSVLPTKIREYGPDDIFLNYETGEVEDFYFFCSSDDDYIELTENIKKWMCDYNIILTKENNYEIPDEYKVEFKLRFH